MRTKRTKAEQAAESTQPTKGKCKGKGKAAQPTPLAPQPGRWVDQDCNAALNMQHSIQHTTHWGEQMAPAGAVLEDFPGLNPINPEHYLRIAKKAYKTLAANNMKVSVKDMLLGEHFEGSFEGLEALPPIGKEYQQVFKLVNDRLPKGRQWLHWAAENRRGIHGRARNNA
ncbi:hypothetical protein QJQ45_026084 [Haematococcus lacustris]|nr:hypothetical protein QJQ45_026084 [Haematococcus lacustris]